MKQIAGVDASRFFRTAHKLTRKLMSDGISYAATFAMVLRDLYIGFEATCIRVEKLRTYLARQAEIAALPVLPAIQAVSDRQAAYAGKRRDERLPEMLRILDDAMSKPGLTADEIARGEAIRRELVTNPSARFWIDVVQSVGRFALVDVATYIGRRQLAAA